MGEDTVDKVPNEAGPRATDKARRQAEEREKRLAEALRANLRRRKSQARARADSPDGGMPEGKETNESAERSSS